MASKNSRRKTVKVKYDYPSRFGSHASMVNQTLTTAILKSLGFAKGFHDPVITVQFGSVMWAERNSANCMATDPSDLVICQDEFGFYATSRDRLSTGLADVNRYSTNVGEPRTGYLQKWAKKELEKIDDEKDS